MVVWITLLSLVGEWMTSRFSCRHSALTLKCLKHLWLNFTTSKKCRVKLKNALKFTFAVKLWLKCNIHVQNVVAALLHSWVSDKYVYSWISNRNRNIVLSFNQKNYHIFAQPLIQTWVNSAAAVNSVRIQVKKIKALGNIRFSDSLMMLISPVI